MSSQYIFALFLMCLSIVVSQLTSDIGKLLDSCIDSKHHKTKPGPEGSLFGQCIPWRDRSCCTSNTTVVLHDDSSLLYDFNFDHCQDEKRLSSNCKRHFIQDHCFYECSPNVGPWTVKESKSWRKERFYKVPLCASDCDAWFKDCQNDFTCTDNWSMNFEWVTLKNCQKGKTCKKNICPSGSRCQTFLEVYKTAENFCEWVWDDSWEYTSDEKPCMRIWFNGSAGNPNDNVAEWRAHLINGGNSKQAEYVVLFTGYVFVTLLMKL